jgi:hypothetical protein
MACCGQQRSAAPVGSAPAMARPAATGAPDRAPADHTVDRSRAHFQYVGRTAATVVGGATGTRYHFARPGAIVAVDARDRPSVSQVPVLRQVVAP